MAPAQFRRLAQAAPLSTAASKLFYELLQDNLIDKLNEQLKRAQEELALHEAQYIAQRNESGAADQTLRDAQQEMEAINFEKKQLLQQWKSALLGMQRRDEALQATP